MAKTVYYTRDGFKRDRSKKRGSYYPSHYKNIKKSRAITFSKLKNGFIVKMDYFGKIRQERKTAFYLVIEPNYTPPQWKHTGNQYMHVFDLSYVPPGVVRKLIEFTKEVRISNFIFARTKFAFLDFAYKKRALYDALLPIMRESYRTLIRNNIHVKTTSIIDYDFQDKGRTINITFIKPSLSNPQVKVQFMSIANSLDIDLEDIQKSAKFGKMTKLTTSSWQSLQNTDSWFYNEIDKDTTAGELEELIELASKDPRKYAPIVLDYEGQLYLVYGEKLMQVCRVIGLMPTVYVISL